ncbi:N-acetylmuramoyl-L-alanine amidase [Pseudochelatococcus lubricantis]|uniref:N-acetylmuramoyl-L-alanine amidase n=1 Tax=Pseudochelatococcus lubricantis TaxID=1538102 RepID=UPI0035E60CC8
MTSSPGTMARPTPDSPVASKVFPSPNHGARAAKAGGEGAARRPDILLLHYTDMSDSGQALNRLCDATSEVSAHYFVFENGHILQLVPEARRAWHAGAAVWGEERDINSASIGIEIAHPGHYREPAQPEAMPPYPPTQIEAVIALARDIVARWGIRADRVLAHSDVAPLRKRDPGEAFPWQELAKAGVGHWVPPAPLRGGRFLSPGERGQPVEALQAMLALYGYGLDIDGHYGIATEAAVRAFQRHFRPERVDGIADASTITTLRDLIAARP